MKWIVCSALIILGTSVFAGDENKDHNYSPGLSKRGSDDTESSKDYVGYSNESNFNNFDREKSNTYKMSVSPPSGGTFIPDSSCSGEVTKDEENLVEGKKLYSKDSIPTSTYIIEMSGQVGFGGEGGNPATWGAYVRNKYYYLTSSNASYNGTSPERIGINDNSSISFTANEFNAPVNSKWVISKVGQSSPYIIDDASTITFNETLWDSLREKGWGEESVDSNAIPGVYNIDATYKKDGTLDSTRTATGKLTIIGIKYVRLVDGARDANRSTRAVDKTERKNKKYEDNPRSDVELSDDKPLLRLPTSSSTNKANVLISIVGTIPSEVANKVLWKIGTQVGTLEKSSVSLEPGPSSHIHSSHDYVMEIGVDLNGNEMIDANEKIPLTYGINVIGNSEYQTAYNNANRWYLALAGVLYPWATAFLSQFKDGTALNSHASTTNVSLNYGLNTYDQKNGFGCNSPTISSGTIKRFEFPNTSGLSSQVLKSTVIFDLLKENITAMQIGKWYQDNPSASFNDFVASGRKQATFSEDDLRLAFGSMTVNYSIGISTQKSSTGKINITGLIFTGYVYDLYDWKSDSAEGDYGCPMLQTTYNPANGRSQGAIFESKVNLNNNIVNMSVEYSNLEEIIDEFYNNI